MSTTGSWLLTPIEIKADRLPLLSDRQIYTPPGGLIVTEEGDVVKPSSTVSIDATWERKGAEVEKDGAAKGIKLLAETEPSLEVAPPPIIKAIDE